ncbi:MAG: hypothetical protein QGH45_25520 [Myxococcota bacterium]|nr:hypothetical protein [Myxococcota bacterium]
MRHALLLLPMFGLLASGCFPKHVGVQAPTKMDIEVVPAVTYADRPEVTGVPDELAEALIGTLSSRNLTPTVMDTSTFAEPFAAKRNSLHRLTWLAGELRGTDLLLLVELSPRYFSLLSGRYRWTVDATLTLTDPADLEAALTTEVKFPIFMDFHHEREDEVLAASIPLLERHLGFLLDEYLGGMGE